LCKILNQNLDEDTAGTGCVFLVEANDMENMPANRVRGQEMSKELGDDAKTVRFVPMDRLVVLGEHVLKQILPQSVELAKALSNETKEFVVCAFLTAAFDDHGRELFFLATWQIDPHQFVTCFLELTRRHDREVDRSPKIDEICVGLILDLDRLLRFVLILAALVRAVLISFTFAVGTLAQDFSFELAIRFFVCFKFRIKFEDVETVLCCQLVIKTRPVRNLVFFLHQIQLLLHCNIVLVLVLPDLEQHLDHVLYPLVDVRLMQDTSELVVYGKPDLRIHLFDVLPDLPHQPHGDLHTIVSGFVQE
jgi:hypothetical protein